MNPTMMPRPGSRPDHEEKSQQLDIDGNGTLDIGELPRPAQGDLRGPPPFLDASGNIRDTVPMAPNFNTTESLLSYLDSNKDDRGSDFGLDLTV